MFKNFLKVNSEIFKFFKISRLYIQPKPIVTYDFKSKSTVSFTSGNESYKSFFINYSTQVVSDKDYVTKLKEIQRNKKMTPYLYFVQTKLKSEYPSQTGKVSQKMLVQAYARDWNKMSEEEKKPFIERASKNTEEQNLKKNELLSTLNNDQIKNLTDELAKERELRKKMLKEFRIKKEKNKLNAPKRPKGAFFLYCDTLDKGDAPIQQFTRGASEKWKLLAQQDKDVFNREASEQMQEYMIKYAEWEKKMIEQGKKNLIRKTTLRTLIPKEKRLRKTKLAKKKLQKKSSKRKIKRKAASKSKAQRKVTTEKKQMLKEAETINQSNTE
ncbi:unnamed protein product [Brachionus calyciflorus]|uniref:HMG box domain-containing protein n=1 Tax=Brachionus calyciflorus TaxID=104777 RepID=A0A813TQ38_9BILA|nr:unnamed protein product [Brachionus calyciflorus]